MSESRVGRVPVRRPAEAGPPLPMVIAVSAGLFLAGILAPLAVSGGEPYPSPLGSDDGALSDYVAAHADALRLAGFFQFAAAVPLAVFAASVVARLLALGVRAAGPTIALSGGLLASAAMTVSACTQWALSRAPVDSPPALLVTLRDLAFVIGGPAHVVGLGLLIAGIAISSAFHRLLARPLWVAGAALALLAELTTLTLVLPGAAYLLPIGRFGGLAWLVAAAVLLPARRPARSDPPASEPPAPGTPTTSERGSLPRAGR